MHGNAPLTPEGSCGSADVSKRTDGRGDDHVDLSEQTADLVLSQGRFVPRSRRSVTRRDRDSTSSTFARRWSGPGPGRTLDEELRRRQERLNGGYLSVIKRMYMFTCADQRVTPMMKSRIPTGQLPVISTAKKPTIIRTKTAMKRKNRTM